MPTKRLLVLYGTTRGFSENGAKEFVSQCAEQLSSSKVEEITGSGGFEVECEGPISLDVFLKEPCWAPLVVIYVSSFGSGDGPMKGRKFRKKCDAWIESYKDSPDKPKPFQGIKFAMCGLGDSSYETYMKNPIVLCEALTLLGAEMVGDRGQADANDGEDAQKRQVEEWTDGIWEHLAKEIVKTDADVPEEQLKAANEFLLKEN